MTTIHKSRSTSHLSEFYAILSPKTPSLKSKISMPIVRISNNQTYLDSIYSKTHSAVQALKNDPSIPNSISTSFQNLCLAKATTEDILHLIEELPKLSHIDSVLPACRFISEYPLGEININTEEPSSKDLISAAVIYAKENGGKCLYDVAHEVMTNSPHLNKKDIQYFVGLANDNQYDESRLEYLKHLILRPQVDLKLDDKIKLIKAYVGNSVQFFSASQDLFEVFKEPKTAVEAFTQIYRSETMTIEHKALFLEHMLENADKLPSEIWNDIKLAIRRYPNRTKDIMKEIVDTITDATPKNVQERSRKFYEEAIGYAVAKSHYNSARS